MIAFRPTPGIPGSLARPLVDVYLDRELLVPQTCLIDTGAAAVRLSAGLARGAGVPLPPEPNAPDLVIAGHRCQVYRTEHELAVELDGAPARWSAPVSFCDSWPHPFGLLGIEGFLDHFDLLVEGRNRRFGLTPRS